jgi:hypothetical protein
LRLEQGDFKTFNTDCDTSSLEFCTMSGIVPIPITGLEVPASSSTRTFQLDTYLTSLSQLLNPVIDNAQIDVQVIMIYLLLGVYESGYIFERNYLVQIGLGIIPMLVA